MKKQRAVMGWMAVATVGALMLSGCSAPQGADSEITVGTVSVGDYNPLDGHGSDGNSPFYDGLMVPTPYSGEGGLPELKTGLAESEPVASADKKTWTIKLRKGVKFSDGQELTSKDVKATYEAVIDPKVAASSADSFRALESIEAKDDQTVVFHLSDPVISIDHMLMLGIMPASGVELGTPAQDWKLNSKPVGTGPYTLDSLEANTAVLKARDDYWGQKADLKTVTYQAYDDSSALVEAVNSGKVSGSVVPPRSADSMVKGDAKLVAARSADYRGLSLPSKNPLTADVKVREAINIGVDREAHVKNVLGGHGHPAYTPAGDFMGEAFNPDAKFEFSRDKANKMLDEAGWVKGADGMRSKDGKPAELTIQYKAGDTLRADVAADIKEQLHELGIKVTTKGQDWDDIMKVMDQDAVVFGGGDQPYDIDHQLRAPLHSRTKTSGDFDNPANLVATGVDAELDKAAQAIEQKDADEAYRKVQELYVEEPTWLFLAFLDHTYINAAKDWETPKTALEPHSHGSEWGPWWRLNEWKKG